MNILNIEYYNSSILTLGFAVSLIVLRIRLRVIVRRPLLQQTSMSSKQHGDGSLTSVRAVSIADDMNPNFRKTVGI
jgi:hypothetical protein